MQERLHNILNYLIEMDEKHGNVGFTYDLWSTEVVIYDRAQAIVFVHRKKDRAIPKDNGALHYVDDPRLEQAEEYLKGVLGYESS